MGGSTRARLAGLTFPLFLGACATITAPNETKALNEATAPFADSLKNIEAQQAAATAASNRAHKFQEAVILGTATYRNDCDRAAHAAQRGYVASLQGSYDAAKVESAYKAFRSVSPCDFIGLAPPPASQAKPIPGVPGDPYLQIAVGNDSLAAVGSGLEAYVESLSDLATGETYGRLAEQRKKAFEAAGAFAGALGVPFATPVAALLNSLVESKAAARRNAATLQILNEIESILPQYMERVGLAGRLAVGATIEGHAQSATHYATSLNAALKDPAVQKDIAARAQLLSLYDERLHGANQSLLTLRDTDPMRAARAFAIAHRALRDVFASPRANRAAVAAGLKSLEEAATGLEKAVDEAKKEKAGA